MEAKGYVLPSGRVVSAPDSPREPVRPIAQLGYRETRYNLRRVLVTRSWVAKMIGAEPPVEFTGSTRRDVIAQAVAYYQENGR